MASVSSPPIDRYTSVTRVLIRVFFLNIVVALAKIAFGYATGIVSVLSDGYHSLTDGASNVVALVGVRVARKPPDEDHPYGHRKFETLATVAILVFLMLVMIEVIQTSVARLRTQAAPEVTPTTFAVMLATIAINIAVVVYESRAGRTLRSEVLTADARHTRSDLLTSVTVLAALAGVALGWPLLDPIAGLVIAVFIGHTGWEIARDSSAILADHTVIPEEELRDVVMSVPGLLGCHHIRTRGPADHVFLDLHIWLDPATRLDEAHRSSHEVKDRLMTAFPSIRDAVIHIEPPPRDESRD